MIKDFFGNEIEVGDEVAFLLWDSLARGIVSEIKEGRVYARDKSDKLHYLAGRDYSELIVDTEKKHREKAVEYHLSQMG
jgi:FKBP-type peptidyl-prolyl cis-trans isomerase 2